MILYASGASGSAGARLARETTIGRQSMAAPLFCANYLILIAIITLASHYSLQALAQETKGGSSSSALSSSSSSSSSSSAGFDTKGDGGGSRLLTSSKFRENILSVQRKQQQQQQQTVQPIQQQVQQFVSQVVDNGLQEITTGQQVEQQQQQQQVEQRRVVTSNRVDNSYQRQSIIEQQQQQQQAEADAEPAIYGSIKGSPGVDFPAYTSIPNTGFSCDGAPFDPGMYADESTACQVYHMCYQGRRESFLCGVGTVFNQAIMSCDFWHSVECSKSSRYYNMNADFGKSSSEPASRSWSTASSTVQAKTNSQIGSVSKVATLVARPPTWTNSFSTKSVQQVIAPQLPIFSQSTTVSSFSEDSSLARGSTTTGDKTSVRKFDQQQQSFNSQRLTGGSGGAPLVSPGRRAAAYREEQLRRTLSAANSQFASESSPMQSIATHSTGAIQQRASVVATVPGEVGVKSRSAGKSIATEAAASRRLNALSSNKLGLSGNENSKSTAIKGSSFGESSSADDHQVWKPYFKSKGKNANGKAQPASSSTAERPSTSVGGSAEPQPNQEPKFSRSSSPAPSPSPSSSTPASEPASSTESPSLPSPPTESPATTNDTNQQSRELPKVPKSDAPPQETRPPSTTASPADGESSATSSQTAVESDVSPEVSSTTASDSGAPTTTASDATTTSTTSTTTTTSAPESSEQTSSPTTEEPSSSTTTTPPPTSPASAANEDADDESEPTEAAGASPTSTEPSTTTTSGGNESVAEENANQKETTKKRRNTVDDARVANASSVEYAD